MYVFCSQCKRTKKWASGVIGYIPPYDKHEGVAGICKECSDANKARIAAEKEAARLYQETRF